MKYSTLLCIAMVAGASVFGGCKPKTEGAAASTDSTKMKAQSPAERGRYLVTIASCNDCHTPLKMGPKGPEPDMSRMLFRAS